MSELTPQGGQASALPSGSNRGVAPSGTDANGTVTQNDTVVPAFDLSTVDWATVDIKNIEKIEPVRKMQQTKDKLVAEAKREASKAQRETQSLKQQLEMMKQMLQGNAPEIIPQFQAVQNQAMVQQLEENLRDYESVGQKEEAFGLMAKRFGVDPELLLSANDPYEAFDIIGDYYLASHAQQAQQLVSLQQQMQAIQARSTDPVSSPDSGSTSVGSLQTEYDQHMKTFHGDKAAAIRRKAEAQGLTLDLSRWRT